MSNRPLFLPNVNVLCASNRREPATVEPAQQGHRPPCRCTATVESLRLRDVWTLGICPCVTTRMSTTLSMDCVDATVLVETGEAQETVGAGVATYSTTGEACKRDRGCRRHHNGSEWRRLQDGCRDEHRGCGFCGWKRSDLDNHHNLGLCHMADRCSAQILSGFPTTHRVRRPPWQMSGNPSQ